MAQYSSSSTSSSSGIDEYYAKKKTRTTEFLLNGVVKTLERVKQIVACRESSSSPQKLSRRHIPRDRTRGNEQLMRDYFSSNTVYTDEQFRRRFQMRKELFLRIVEELGHRSEFFQQRYDAVGNLGLSPIQKCTATIRQLAYGGLAEMFDEYIRIGEKTSIDCLKMFSRAVCEVFGPRYLRRPTIEDVERLHAMHLQRHGFPRMLGSIDCMHWAWRNCPIPWKGQYTRGDKGHPTIMLEAVASADLWIWHAFFGVAGSNNDLNVLNQSPLFNDVLDGEAPELEFQINHSTYKRGYYLADGIYLEWAIFVKSFSATDGPKMLLFKEKQESARKDIKRAYDVLQARWAIIRGPACGYFKPRLKDIMLVCIILHNMIVEDECMAVMNWNGEERDSSVRINSGWTSQFHHILERFSDVRSRETHHKPRSDLVEHLRANRD